MIRAEIETNYLIFKQVNPNLHESVQKYDKSLNCRLSHLVMFEKKNKIVCVWSDFKDLNQ
jgi:uncharacterized protein YfbU (UPF0304 family)